MKHDWEYKQIGDVCEVLNGLWTGKKPPFVNVGVIRNTNFTKECTLDPSNIFYTDVEVKAYSKRKLEHGDIIIEKSGGSDKQPVGRPILFNLDGEFSFSNFTSVLRIKDDSIIPNFFHKALTGIYYQGKTRALQSKTTGIHNLDFNKYLRLYIPVPPLPIQEQICSLLDKMNRVIEAKKEQLKELDNLAQAIFYDMFGDPAVNEKGWDMKVLEELLKIPSRNGLTKPTAIRGAGVPMISMGEMFANPIITDKVEASLVPVTQRELDSSQVISGDLLFARQSLSLEGAGKCSYVKSCQNPTVFESHLIRIRVDDKIVLPKYVYSFFRTNSGITEIRKRVYQVAAAGIKGSELIKIPIPVPHLSLQQLFVERVEAIEKQKELINQSIKDVQTLFDAKMDYYFGE